MKIIVFAENKEYFQIKKANLFGFGAFKPCYPHNLFSFYFRILPFVFRLSSFVFLPSASDFPLMSFHFSISTSFFFCLFPFSFILSFLLPLPLLFNTSDF